MNANGEFGGETATVAPSLPDMIFAHTDGGEEIVATMVDFMHGRADGARPADRLAAARELMDRAWGKPPTASTVSGADGADDGDQADDSAARLTQMIAAALSSDGDGGESA